MAVNTTARLRIASRGSRLALAQTNTVIELLRKARPALEIEIIPIKTLGDIIPPSRLEISQGKVAFTGEIERRLLAGEVDVAVHSMKDLPSEITGRLTVAATPVREDPRDILVSPARQRLSKMKVKPVIGTSSIRRRVQLLKMRPDANLVEMHGNVETRLKQMETRQLDGVVLAAAGLRRLGLEGRISQIFEPTEMTPAVCQGTIVVEARTDDAKSLALLNAIDNRDVHVATECERAFSRRLGGDCNVPLGAMAVVRGKFLEVIGMVASSDGANLQRRTISGNASNPVNLGETLAETLIEAFGGTEAWRGKD